MTSSLVRTLGVALALLLAAAAHTQAAPVNWQYNASPGATDVFSDNPGDLVSRVNFSNEGEVKRIGNSFITASNLSTFSGQDVSSPAMFTNRAFTFTVALRDGHGTTPEELLALPTGVLTFHGSLDGTLWNRGSQLTYTILDPMQSLVVGNHRYDVSFDDQARRINGPEASRQTSIDGSITVHDLQDPPPDDPPDDPPDVPEPSTAILSVLGLAGLGAYGVRRWRKAAR